jgi:hypothetical protein
MLCPHIIHGINDSCVYCIASQNQWIIFQYWIKNSKAVVDKPVCWAKARVKWGFERDVEEGGRARGRGEFSSALEFQIEN